MNIKLINVLMIVFTLANILACLWLIWWTAKRRSGAKPAQEAETTGHEWDGIQELNTPMPRWWLGLFIGTIVFGLGYLWLYPGLGFLPGTQDWSQTKQLHAEQAQATQALQTRFAALANTDLVSLAQDQAAMATAKNLFANYCSTCHGADARGARGFPDLTDHDWLWGGSAEAIYTSIAQGRKGTMPAWGQVLGEQGVEEVAAYVLSLSGHNAPADWVAAGQQRFATLCATCHGSAGLGNQVLGAPNLTDKVWLYGNALDAVRQTIAQGRNNEMPAHLESLGEMRVRLLAAYVYGLSQAQLE